MMIKTPKFWLKKSPIAFFLLPLSLVYQVLALVNGFFTKQNKINKKIICIGNITVGGSGKTPVALMIGEILKENNIEFAYLTRGHRGKGQAIRQVDLQNCKPKDVGDEALILAEKAPTFFAKNRFAGAKIIEQSLDFQAIILDDGMQNKNIKKDFLILVVDAKIQFGNGFIFPAGPLRQSVASGLKQADLVVVVGEIDEKLQEILGDKKFIEAKIKTKNLEEFQQKKLLAFCGIAYPKKFFSHLENQGLQLVEKVDFPDHYFYTKQDLENLQKKAFENGAKLITTKKDWVKFSPQFQRQISFLDIELEPQNKNLLKTEIIKIFK